MDKVTDEQTERMRRLLEQLREDPALLEDFLRLGERLASYRRGSPRKLGQR